MIVAVIYSEETERYGQHYPRYIIGGVVQGSNESDGDFTDRVKSEIEAKRQGGYKNEVLDYEHITAVDPV